MSLLVSCSSMKILPSAKPVAHAADQRRLAGWGAPLAQNVEGINQIESEYVTGSIAKACDAAIADHQKRVDAIAKLDVKQRTYASVNLEFEDAGAVLSDVTNPLTFMKYVSGVEASQDEGSACEEKISQYSVSVLSRRDLYDALKSMRARNAGERRLAQQTLLAFEKNGLGLGETESKKVTAIKTEIAKLEADFSDTLNKDNSTVIYTAAELDGCPADFLGRLEKTADGKLIATTKSTDYQVVLRNSKNPETRKRMLFQYWNRAVPKNTETLKLAIAKRREVAKLLGYDSWLASQVSDRMAKTRPIVESFLADLTTRLSASNKKDLEKILKFKQESEPAAKSLDLWDIEYYSYQLKKRDYSLDDEVIREYFPADVVVAGIFSVYSKLLGVTFHEVAGAKVWSGDVKLYEIRDKKSGKSIAAFYTDLLPRPKKYGHAAAFSLISGRNLDKKTYVHPTSAIVANFTPPANGKPSMLTHQEVETFFHEFGHIMHQTLTSAPYGSLSGSSTARDFVEAPSQMLENWVYEPKVLDLVSGHYLDHAKKLPKELLEKIIAARDFNQGYAYTRQLVFATVDVTYHTATADLEPTPVFNEVFERLVGVPAIPGGNFPASFGHLMGGYDAGYYGYLWSEVYAEDMFTLFEKGGLLSPKVGARYRKMILEKGNMEENMSMLRRFLGREPNSKAFFKRLHI